MTGPQGAEIRYTVDGTDPGHFSLATSNSIIVYQDSIILPEEGETLTIYARTKLDTLWSTLVNRTFTIDAPSIITDNPITTENYLSSYPNPMKDYTNIKYFVSEPSFVSLKVYNATGEYITTLENSEKQQGEHTVVWNSGNNPPGIYFCIFDNYNNTKRYRIMMIKYSHD
jgi:hypothetical protein